MASLKMDIITKLQDTDCLQDFRSSYALLTILWNLHPGVSSYNDCLKLIIIGFPVGRSIDAASKSFMVISV